MAGRTGHKAGIPWENITGLCKDSEFYSVRWRATGEFGTEEK